MTRDRQSLPPLNALRVFVTAARHQSFARAAIELNVTQGAVSRQIKSLEDFLGIALFERHVRQVNLTLEGQQLFAETGPALKQISTSTRALMKGAPIRMIRINVRPSFAVRWLIPRLSNFVAQYPDIEPKIVTTTKPPFKATETFDIAIRRGLDGWPPSLSVRPFLEDELIVVSAPALVKSQSFAEPQFLSKHILLSCKTRKQDWDDWKTKQRLTRLKPAGRLQLDHLHLVLQAAVDGLGFALAPTSLLGADLRLARLLSPLPELRMPLEANYYGVAPDAGRETLLFVGWLNDQARSES